MLIHCKNSKVFFTNDISSARVGFLINVLEARKSLEYLNYIRETKMIPPLLSAIRLHSLISERERHHIIYNEFFIAEALKDLIIIYRTLGATILVNKLEKDLKKYRDITNNYKKNLVTV